MQGTRVAFLAWLVALGGCTTLADVSSGHVGCPPGAITISDERQSWGGSTWTAECNGQRYTCSAHGGGSESTPQVSCTPMGSSAVPGGSDAVASEPVAGGCQYDTQCKGDRVCEGGACVDPPSEAAGSAAAPATPPQ